MGQAGLTLKRKMPSAEELAEAGLPLKVAQEIQDWMELLEAVRPDMIDERMTRALKQQARNERNYRAALRKVAEHEAGQRHGEEQGPG